MVIAACLLVALPAQAQDSGLPPDSINLVIEALPPGLTVGQSFAVSVVSRIDTPAYGFGFQIQYDPAILQVFPRPESGGSEVPFVIGTAFGQNPQRVKNADEVTGSARQIDVVYTLLPPAQAASGEGTLGTVVFTIVAEGSTEIRLVNPRLIEVVDGTARDITLSAGSDTLTLNITQSGAAVAQSAGTSEGQTDTPSLMIPIVALGTALIALFIIIVVFIRRRRQRA